MADVTAQLNQIDGDPEAIHTHSRYYGQIAQAVVSTVAHLRSVTDTLETTSEAVAAFAAIAQDVSVSLEEVDDRYRTLAEHLAYFAGQVERLQGESALVQSQARDADIERRRTAHARDDAYERAQWAATQDPQAAQAYQDYRRYADRVLELSGAIANDERRLDQLLTEWRAVADGCAEAIDAVVAASDLNDSWWTNFADWVEDTLPDIEFILDAIAIVLTIAAFLMVLSGVGAVLAPALFAIARGIQLLSRLVMVMKVVTTTVQVARGKANPGAFLQIGVDFAIDAVGGRIVDGAADRLGTALMATYGDDLVALAATGNNDVLTKNVLDIQADGFDDWVSTVFEAAVDTPAGTSAAERLVLDGAQGAADLADAISAKSDMVKNGLLQAMTGGQVNLAEGSPLMAALDAFAGPSTELSGLAFDGIALATAEFTMITGTELDPVDMESLMSNAPGRPSFDAMVASS